MAPVTLTPVTTPIVSEHHLPLKQGESMIEVVIGDVTLTLCGGVDLITLSAVLGGDDRQSTSGLRVGVGRLALQGIPARR